MNVKDFLDVCGFDYIEIINFKNSIPKETTTFNIHKGKQHKYDNYVITRVIPKNINSCILFIKALEEKDER